MYLPAKSGPHVAASATVAACPLIAYNTPLSARPQQTTPVSAPNLPVLYKLDCIPGVIPSPLDKSQKLNAHFMPIRDMQTLTSCQPGSCPTPCPCPQSPPHVPQGPPHALPAHTLMIALRGSLGQLPLNKNTEDSPLLHL